MNFQNILYRKTKKHIGNIFFVAFKNFRRANPYERKSMCSSEPPTGHQNIFTLPLQFRIIYGFASLTKCII